MIPHDDVEGRPDSSSFPSGPTGAAVGFIAAVAFTSPGRGAAAAVPTARVALERLHTGAHYPSDVVAGAATGAGSAVLVHHAPRLPRALLECADTMGARVVGAWLDRRIAVSPDQLSTGG
ncbi:phosphatase PAP2 family protein [Streptomyces sp. NPDC003016]